MYLCPNCGGNVKFDIELKRMKCYSCDSSFEVSQFDKEEKERTYDTNVYMCPQCGGELLGDENEVAVFCIFCGASNVLESRMKEEERPDYIIPFMKTKEDCKRLYKKHIGKSIYAPSYLKKEATIDSFRGIYMPYWYYSVKKDSTIHLQGGREQRKGDYIYKDNFQLKGHLTAEINGMIHDASSSFTDNLSENLGTYDEKDMVEFNPAYLSGFYADSVDVDKKIYEKKSIEQARTLTKKKVYADAYFREKFVHKNNNRAYIEGIYGSSDVKGYKAMFPVWFMSYRAKDRMYYSLVNGQTGEVSGSIPIDPIKFILFSLIATIPIWIGLYFIGYINAIICLFITSILTFILFLLITGGMESFINKEDRTKIERLLHKENNEEPTSSFAKMDEYEESLDRAKKYKSQEKDNGIIKKIVITILIMTVYLAFGYVNPSLFERESGAVMSGVIIGAFGIIGIVRLIKTYTNLEKSASKRFGVILPILSLVLSTVCMFMAPVNDSIYYIMSIVCVVMSIGSVLDLIYYHNLLCTNPLPQFERAGGDDNA